MSKSTTQPYLPWRETCARSHCTWEQKTFRFADRDYDNSPSHTLECNRHLPIVECRTSGDNNAFVSLNLRPLPETFGASSCPPRATPQDDCVLHFRRRSPQVPAAQGQRDGGVCCQHEYICGQSACTQRSTRRGCRALQMFAAPCCRAGRPDARSQTLGIDVFLRLAPAYSQRVWLPRPSQIRS